VLSAPHAALPRGGPGVRVGASPAVGARLFTVSLLVTSAALAVSALPAVASPPSSLLNRPSTTPPSTAGVALEAVSCAAAQSCYAVGSSGQVDAEIPAIEREIDGNWRAESPPSPPTSSSTSLEDVSCTSWNACTAVGFASTTSHFVIPVAERWNGVRWRVQSPPLSGAASTLLTGVSCATVTSCTAVGYSSDGDAVIERWNGTSWNLEAAPTPPGNSYWEPIGVSCSSVDACTAVGTAESALSETGVVERWNGRRWRDQVVASPAGSTSSTLRGVTCLSANSCVAVGTSISSGVTTSLVEKWAGDAWSVESTPRPAGASSLSLTAVACASLGSCLAVGSYDDDDRILALSEHWNGAKWVLQEPLDPSGSNDVLLNGVACPGATSCESVGGAYTSTGVPQAVAERWKADRWTLERVPAVPPPPHAIYYLALGDSVPVWEGTDSYPYLILARERRRLPNLELDNLAESGATTTSMRDDGQFEQALAFLRQHRGHVALITIDIGGNDVVGCFSTSGPNPACFRRGKRMIRRNLSAMLRHLRAAAPGVSIVGMTYYDPFLGDWLAGGTTRSLVLDTIPKLLSLNRELASLYGPKHTADVQDAFASTQLSKMVGSRWGTVPLAVKRACSWLDIECHRGAPEGFGDDPDVAGERVIARTFEKLLGRTLGE
jgi:lysophospholipase L1-like esterase